MTIQAALHYGTKMFTSNNQKLDAEVLLAHILHRDRTWLFTHDTEELTTEQQTLFHTLLQRRRSGEPIAYIIGKKEFYGLTFAVNNHVLVPRPETEILVEQVLACIQQHPDITTLLDIGTGSGAIAISLAHAAPRLRISACDISPDALAVARANATRLGIQVEFFESNLLHRPDGLETHYDIVTANLPYIGTVTHADVEQAVDAYEPHVALYGGPDGLDLYRTLVQQLTAWQTPPYLLACEIAPGQGAELASIIRATFPEANITIKQDLAGLDRVVLAELKITMKPPSPSGRGLG